MSMEKILCPNCGSKHTEYIQSGVCDCRTDLEVHPFLYRCLDCGEVFPGNAFPMTELPDEV